MLRESLDAWINTYIAAYRVLLFSFIFNDHFESFHTFPKQKHMYSLKWLDKTSLQTKLTVDAFSQEWIVCHILSFFETGMWWKDWRGIALRTEG